ncbi:MAG: polyprenyl synthetase family protein [Pyrinomonadaceae bacterium]
MATVSSSVSPVVNPTAINAKEFLASTRLLIDKELDQLIAGDTDEPARLHRAIRWSVFAGGKRFRPALVLAVGETFGAATDQLLRTACAFEMIHTYSLIHDDLPSMDDDDLRRGRPTCHIKFGEATAILAGDALQALAFQTIAADENLSAETRVRIIAELSRAAGTPSGMVSGQARDLDGEAQSVDAASLDQIHLQKTGALISAAARCGAIIGGANDDELESVTDYSRNLGLLFQITDDLLDVTASASAMGKTPGKDARASKATYPAVHGIDATRRQIDIVRRSACDAATSIKRPAELLISIVDLIADREA